MTSTGIAIPCHDMTFKVCPKCHGIHCFKDLYNRGLCWRCSQDWEAVDSEGRHRPIIQLTEEEAEQAKKAIKQFEDEYGNQS